MLVQGLDRLQAQLLTSGLSQKNQPLYQVIHDLIRIIRTGFDDIEGQVINLSTPSTSTIVNSTVIGEPPDECCEGDYQETVPIPTLAGVYQVGSGLIQQFKTRVATGPDAANTYSDVSGTTILPVFSAAGSIDDSVANNRSVGLYSKFTATGTTQPRAFRGYMIVNNAAALGSAALYTGTIEYIGAGALTQSTIIGAGIILNNAGLVITNNFGIDIQAPTITAGAITSQAGIRINSLTGATNNTHLLLGQAAIPAGNFGIYNASTNDNYFNGEVGIGTSTPGGALDIVATYSVDQAFGFRENVTHNTATAGTVYGGQFNATITHAAGTMNSAVGLTNAARFGATANATNLSGEQCFIALTGASPTGTITTAQGLNLSQVANFASGAPAVTISQARGLIVGDIGAGHGVNGLTISNVSAISLAGSQTAATNAAVINISNTTSVPFAPTGTWSIFNASTRNNHFAGNILVGTTTALATGTNAIAFADGTAPTITAASNMAAIYSDDVGGTTKMFSVHEDGVAGQLAQLAGNLTSGRVALVTTNGQLTDDANITYDATANRLMFDVLFLGHTTTWGGGTNFISFADGTAPTTPATNTAAIYGDDVGGTVMLFAIDEASGITRLNHVNRALGGGAAATLGTIGGSGPATAAQDSWMEYSVGGTTYWIPVWR